jgi:hypothetical protein
MACINSYGMTMKNTLQEGWTGYERQVVPPDATDAQRMDLKNVFYAGALITLNLIDTYSAQSEDAAMLLLKGLHDEVKAHFNG